MEHRLPELPYAYDSLEPYIDAKTMEIHHTKHHQAYIDKLNLVLKKYKRFKNNSSENLMVNKKLPKEDRIMIKNNAGGHLNHSFFWPLLKKNSSPKGEILKAITQRFGNFEKFKAEFTEVSMKVFGSGWSWLVLNKGVLDIITTPNQENPISKKMLSIIGLDLWEHAYYLKYQNKRLDYVEAFFHVINWEQVNKNYLNAIKSM